MSVLQYPQYQYMIVANSGTVELGNFTGQSGELGLFQIRAYHKKSGAFSYQIRVVFAASEGGPALAATAWETFDNDTIGQTTDEWLGDLVFDVDRYRLNALADTFVRIELTGYTRPAYPNQNTAYLGFWCDWIEPVNGTNSAAARMSMGVYQ